MSYPNLAAIRVSYSYVKNGKTVPLATRLRHLVQALFARMKGVQTPAFRYLLRIPQVLPESAIFSIQLDEPKRLAAFLQGRGMMVRAVVPPTVPEGTSRVRVCLHAGNTEDEIRVLVAAMEEWCVTVFTDQSVGQERASKLEGTVLARL